LRQRRGLRVGQHLRPGDDRALLLDLQQQRVEGGRRIRLRHLAGEVIVGQQLRRRGKRLQLLLLLLDRVLW